MTEIKSVCVYCGSSGRVSERYRQLAERLGQLVAARGVDLVYGGGRVGLMGLAADAALAAGGRVVGIIPEHIQQLEVEHTGLSELLVVDSMHTRKRLMFERSDAFVVLPGGLGTLDETVEIITWRQLGLHDKPVVIVDDGDYWRPFLRLIDHMVDSGFARDEHRSLYAVVNSVDGVFDALAKAPSPTIEPQAKWL